MAHNDDGQYKLDITLTKAELDALVPRADGSVTVATIILGAGWARPCPGRKGATCKGDGSQRLQLRNMDPKVGAVHEVRDQPCCSRCR